MTGEAEATKWISPGTERKAAQRARDRAQAARWNLDIAIFLFAVLIIVIILLFQGIGTGIVTPVALFGLAMVWLGGWRRGWHLYRRFYDEELARYPDAWKEDAKIIRLSSTSNA